MEILTSDEMRQADRRAVGRFGVPEIVLMENAGLRLYDHLRRTRPDLDRLRLVVLCGRGNNGGDALVLARHLHNRGLRPEILLCGRPEEVRGSAGVNLRAVRRLGASLQVVRGPADWARARGRLARADLIVDGLLGTGLSRPVSGLLARVVAAVNRSGAQVLAVDIPSGLSGDRAQVPGPAVRADHTVTFARPKIPHVFPPARDLCGQVVVADISLPPAAVASVGARLHLLRPAELRPLVPPRPREGHKGRFGHVLVVAGSRGKAGAARMAALGALRAGCGLVTAAVPASLQGRLVAGAMEVMTEGLPETPEGTLAFAALPRLTALLEGKTAVALGPGLTTHPETKRLVPALVRRVRVPLVLDADGLNAYAGRTRLLAGRGRPLILTPHPGEMGRLLGRSASAVQADRVGAARGLAEERHCHVVLKGHLSLIADPKGRVSVNPTGNPGMATGGSGDVLTGLLAGLLGQRLEPGEATRLGVYLHGLAGDLAAERLGEMPLVARDILSAFPGALRQLMTVGAAPAPLEEMP